MGIYPGYTELNAGKTWSVSQVGTTYRFEVRSGDVAAGDPSTKERSELKMDNVKMATGQTYDIHYKIMVEPGSNNIGQLIIGQLHGSADAQDYKTMSPPFAVQLVDGHLAISVRADPNAVSTTDAPGYSIYQDPNEIVRGQWYDLDFKVTMNPTGMGGVDASINGADVAHYRGELGYNDQLGAYWKMGIYRMAAPDAVAVDYKDFTFTDVSANGANSPTAPLVLGGDNLGFTFISTTDHGVMAGSAGIDTANFIGAASGVNVNLALTGAQNTGGGGVQTITSVENVIGSHYDDTIEGSSANNVLTGNAGVDTVSYQHATAGVTVDLSLQTAQNTKGAGIDTLVGFQNLVGSGFSDVLRAGGGTHTIQAGAGDDLVYADSGTALYDGGAGTDTLSMAYATQGVVVSLGLNAAQGTGLGAKTILNFEKIDGSNYGDKLYGDDAANTLTGGAGADSLTGGGGADTFRYVSASDSTVAAPDLIRDFQHGVDKIDLTGILGVGDKYSIYDTGWNSSVLDVDLHGDGSVDMRIQLVGKGVLTASDIIGDSPAADPKDLTTTVVSGSGTNSSTPQPVVGGDTVGLTFVSTTDNGVMAGGAGIDTANFAGATSGVNVSLALTGAQNTGGGGVQTIASVENVIGSHYNDTIEGSSANNVLTGNGGVDTVSYQHATAGVTVDLTLQTAQDTKGAGIDTLVGFPNLVGSGFNDVLRAGGGMHTIQAGAGDDLVYADSGTALYDGGAGTDTLSMAYATRDVAINLGLTGAQSTGTGAKTILNFEMVVGSNYGDKLFGDANNNALTGGAGADSLSGGGGADTFRYVSASDSTVAAPDLIRDFQHGIDKIDLTGILGAGDKYSIYNSGTNTTVLDVDLHGDGSVDMRIQLVGKGILTSSDLIGV